MFNKFLLFLSYFVVAHCLVHNEHVVINDQLWNGTSNQPFADLQFENKTFTTDNFIFNGTISGPIFSFVGTLSKKMKIFFITVHFSILQIVHFYLPTMSQQQL